MEDLERRLIELNEQLIDIVTSKPTIEIDTGPGDDIIIVNEIQQPEKTNMSMEGSNSLEILQLADTMASSMASVNPQSYEVFIIARDSLKKLLGL